MISSDENKNSKCDNSVILEDDRIITNANRQILLESREIYIPPRVEIVSIRCNRLIEKAREFAKEAHDGQERLDGTEFVTHPIRVAENVEKYKQSKCLHLLIASAYLHDTIEDTATKYEDIYENFGATVASLVMELTSDDDMKHKLGKSKYLSKKMQNMTSWALTIKLCDTLDNISDLENTPEKFKEKYTKEKLEIMDYLLRSRTLSGTQLTIIKEIVKKLSLIITPEDEKSASIKRLKFVISNLEKRDL